MKDETKGLLLGLVGVSAFGLTLPVTKVVLPYLDPVFIGLGRAVVAAILAGILLLVTRQKRPNASQVKRLFLVALGVVVGFPVLSSWAMQYVPASHGGVVLGVLPLMTALFGVLFGHERPSGLFWLVSLFGTGLVVFYALLQGSGGFHLADLALLGAIVAAAVGYALGAELSKELGGWQVICWALVLILPLIVLPVYARAPESLASIPAEAYASFFYLALVSQFLAFFAWYRGLMLGGTARVSQIQLLQPFITLLASILFLNEQIDAQTMVFIFLVVCSVWLGKKIPIGLKASAGDVFAVKHWARSGR